MTILAIDQGTSSTRALKIDHDHTISLDAPIMHQQHYPRSGWVEHSPSEIFGNIQALLAQNPQATAIGLANQGESCLGWHADTKAPLTPIIVWQDNRTTPQVDQLIADGAAELVMERAGLPLDPYFSATKLAWIVNCIPAAQALLRAGKLRLGTTDAWFIDRLCGNCLTDVSTASRTSLMNLHSGEWDPDLCALFGVPLETLPKIVPTVGAFGSIKLAGRDVPVVTSVVDQQAALYGHGCRFPGQAKITLGSGAFALAVTGDEIVRAPERGLLPTVAWQRAGSAPTYALDGGVYCAASAVNWARSLGLFAEFAEINQFSGATAIERGLVFVPALSGLACPHWDRSARGMWLGMTLDTERGDLVQAVLEGVAFRCAQVLSAMGDHITVSGPLSIDGGLASNPYFCQLLANILQRDVRVQSMPELTAYGTALLASNDPVDSLPGGEIVSPKLDLSHQRARFGAAVERCRDWSD